MALTLTIPEARRPPVAGPRVPAPPGTSGIDVVVHHG
jgi:hypothetical protein